MPRVTVQKNAKDASTGRSLLIFLLASGSLLADLASAQAVDPGIRTVGLPGDLEVLPGANATEQQLFFSGIDGFGQGWEFFMASARDSMPSTALTVTPFRKLAVPRLRTSQPPHSSVLP
jgi:hypothetical protein